MKIILLILTFAVSGLSYSQSLNSGNSSGLKNKDYLKQMSNKDYLKQLDNQVFVSYNYIRNLGQFGDKYDYGSGVLLNYGKYFPNSWLAVLRIGYMTHELRAGVDSGYADFKVYPVHIGGRYYVYKNIVMPYFSFMNGLNLISNNNYLAGGQDDQFLIRYAFQVGFGFDVKFARNVGVNFNINYNNSFYQNGDSYINQPSAMMTGFEYSGGVSYDFGR